MWSPGFCDCGCCTYIAEKTIFSNGDIFFEISIQDGRYDHNLNTFWGRIKRAFSILLGKPVCFNEVYLEGEDYAKLCTDMQALLKDVPQSEKKAEEIQS